MSVRGREESEIISHVGVGTVRQSPAELDKVVDHMAYLSGYHASNSENYARFVRFVIVSNFQI